MRPFAFDHSVRGGLHRYAHAPGEAVVVERPNWPVLCSSWPDGAATPMSRHAVSNGNTEEVAAYLGLIWRLTAGRMRYATPAYYRDQAAALLGRDPVLVSWEFDVAADEALPQRRENGFVPARACVPIRPEPAAGEVAHRHEAGLFRLGRYADLVDVTRATLGDASAEVSVFALAEDRLDDLVEALRAPGRPRLTDLLGRGDLFVDLTIGVDLGYADSLLVYAQDDITAQVEALAHEYERSIEAYEARVPGVTTVEALLLELDRLSRGG
jgi:hypothetical protein